MTCDSGRPCKRCNLRGLADSCEDAPRKRKKYLVDVPNTALAQDGTAITTGTIEKSKSLGDLMDDKSKILDTQNLNEDPQQLQNQRNLSFPPAVPQAEPILNQALYNNFNSYQPSPQTNVKPPSQSSGQILLGGNPGRRTNFLSSAADLEYSTLSSILQDNIHHPNLSTSNEGTPTSTNLSPDVSPHINQRNNSNSNNHHHHNNNPSPIDIYESSNPTKPKSSSQSSYQASQLRNKPVYESNHYPKCDESINQYFLGPTEIDSAQLFPNVITAIETMKQIDPNVYQERNAKLSLSFTIGIVPEDDYNYRTSEENDNPSGYEGLYKEPEEIYARVTKPFSYTPGYHSLIAYLRKRFTKPMLVKMAESMAAYRPSFIACTNSLKECDLIFMEQCFQRTLLTYDNFIKVNGTPTIVWRRTGEIAYVGSEFCMLTGWTKEELIGHNNRKFIVELLDDKSVVEYFQLFLRIAFGDFLGATMTECTLLTPKPNVKVRTGCMWTLKRDVFGIPMMIIGNFLPILT